VNAKLRLPALAVLAGLVVAATATPAHAQNPFLEFGHVDVFDIDYLEATNSLDVNVSADSNTNAPGVHDPASVAIEVTRDLTVPASWDICATGSAWVLPQSVPQNQLDEFVWAGWNTHDVDEGDVTGNLVTVNLVDVENPSGGSTGFCIYTAAAGAVSQIYLDDDGSPSSFTVPAGDHVHANWTFAEPGTYQVTINVTAPGATASGNHTFTFEVID
jgi:surface-anchored protein